MTAWAACTRAPQAQRSEQACSVVSLAFSQGSLTSAGKPSTLCRSGWPLVVRLPGKGLASSGADPSVCSPARLRAVSRLWAGSFAAQPLQRIGSGPAAA